MNDTGDTGTTYTDETVEADTTYIYAVTALSLDGDSPRSDTVEVEVAGGSEPVAVGQKGSIGITPRHGPTHTDAHTVAVSNIGSANPNLVTGPSSLVSNSALATAFTTGSHSAGYTLQAAQLKMNRASGTGVSVHIYSDSSGSPGSNLTTL